MAKLLSTPAAGEWNQLNGETFSAYMIRAGEELQTLVSTGKVITFPVADGNAFYVVVKEKPLTLRWIPYGDKWQVHPATIRGLTLKDVQKMIEGEKWMREMFSGKSVDKV